MIEAKFFRDIIFIKKEGVNMKDIRALNHNLQNMTKKELSNICKAHHYSLNDDELKIVLHLMKNNPSSILNEEYQIIFLN